MLGFLDLSQISYLIGLVSHFERLVVVIVVCLGCGLGRCPLHIAVQVISFLGILPQCDYSPVPFLRNTCKAGPQCQSIDSELLNPGVLREFAA